MPAPKIRGDYGELNRIAQDFARHAETCRKTLQSLKRAKSTLEGGHWIGQGAKRFYQEMDSEVLPRMKSLAAALEGASKSTQRMIAILKKAEEDAARLFILAASGLAGAAGGAAVAGVAAAGTGSGPVSAVSPQEAKKIFRDMANEKDIAFNYPNDGCYARAHLMNSRILARYGVTPSKVWAFGNLRVPTTGPYGEVRWNYHVAPAIPVRQPDGSTQMMVIDPSIASDPVPVKRWAAIMHTSAANTQVTATGVPPTHPGTGQPFPGTGYWPGPDPTAYGGPDGYSAEVMRRYKRCGNAGTNCTFVPPN